MNGIAAKGGSGMCKVRISQTTCKTATQELPSLHKLASIASCVY